MQFPDRDEMTSEEVARNAAAVKDLVRGKYFRFDPPVTATAVPTGGHGVCALQDCTFDRGWYIGLVDGNHVFQGKPTDDQRVIPVPAGYEDNPNCGQIVEDLRSSYFHVLFIGGSTAVLDTDQSY